MYCKNCGKEIRENQAYCKYCGERVEDEDVTIAPQQGQAAFAAPAQSRPKTKLLIALILLVAVAAAAVICYFQFIKTTSVDLASQIEVKFTGTEGSGYAEIIGNNIDYDKTNKKLQEFISVEGIGSFGNYKIEPEQGKLKTGDKVTVSVPYSSETAKAYHVKVTNAQKTFTIGEGSLKAKPAATADAATVRTKARTLAEECIFPDSSRIYLTDYDVQGMSSSNLKIARNEIFARHGRLFDTADLQNYFNTCSWYYGYIAPEDFDESVLSDIEKSNIRLFQKYE